jgi:hypothetical protein
LRQAIANTFAVASTECIAVAKAFAGIFAAAAARELI